MRVKGRGWGVGKGDYCLIAFGYVLYEMNGWWWEGGIVFDLLFKGKNNLI